MSEHNYGGDNRYQPTPGSAHPPKDMLLSDSLDENAETLKTLFRDDDTFLLRPVRNRFRPERRYFLAYCAGMIDLQYIGDSIIRPLINAKSELPDADFISTLIRQELYAHSPKECDNFQDLAEAITYGDTVLLLPGQNKALILSTQGFPLRGIGEPDGEKILSGPKEGFCESLLPNLTFIHRKLRSNDVKMRFHTFGERSRTRACVCYIDSLVNRELLGELERRLETVCVDGVLDSFYLLEMIEDHRLSPFDSIGTTERPDVVAAKLLEGRIAVFVDGTPVVLTLPYLFVENFQSNEDYYLNFYYTSFARILRILGFCLSTLTPGIYISITAFHHEILPTPLLINIMREKQIVPLPMGLELLIMLVIFDILRETGIRMPTGIGQAMSIVGALVLGDAAVSAKVASSQVIIVVALTGITSLLIPKLGSPVLLARYLILLASMLMGFPGFVLSLALSLTHILSLYSFGVPQITLSGRARPQDMKDIAVRTPLWTMRERRPVASDLRRQMRVRRWWK